MKISILYFTFVVLLVGAVLGYYWGFSDAVLSDASPWSAHMNSFMVHHLKQQRFVCIEGDRQWLARPNGMCFKNDLPLPPF